MGKCQKHKKTSHSEAPWVSLFPAGDHKAARHRQGNMSKTNTNKTYPQNMSWTYLRERKTHVHTTMRRQYNFLSYLL